MYGPLVRYRSFMPKIILHANVEHCDGAGTWHAVPPPIRRCRRCAGRPGAPCVCGGSRLYPDIWFPDTNWAVYTALAGIADPPFPCISEPRGLPADLSADYRQLLERLTAAANGGPELDWRSEAIDYFYLGDYGVSWLTLAEIAGYDWTQLFPHPTRNGDPLEIGYLTRDFLRVIDRDLRPIAAPEDVRIIFGFEGYEYPSRVAHLRRAHEDIATLLGAHPQTTAGPR